MRRLAALSAAFVLTAISSASAQPPPGRDAPRASPEMLARREAHQKQRAQDLRTVLRLRPDQDAALVAFLQARKPSQMGERHGPPARPLSTPERLDEMAKRSAELDARRQRQADAIRTFYAALAPDQRQTFDALMRLGGPHHGPDGRAGLGRGGFKGPRGPGGPPPNA